MRRSLSREEAALWARVAGTVSPIHRRDNPPPLGEVADAKRLTEGASHSERLVIAPLRPFRAPTPKGEDIVRPLQQKTLDANWDRKLAHGLVSPDFTLDLHGYSLDAAHARLEHGLALALAQGARMVLLITGKQRPSDGNSGRSERRGAIRAKFLDWLANGSHGSRIAAIRPAHPRHGGAGAVYVVLRRTR